MYVWDQAVGPEYGPLDPAIPGHCQTPPGYDGTSACRFVYRVPCGCEGESYDLGDSATSTTLKPHTVITTGPGGTTRVQQTLNEEDAPSDPAAGPKTYTRLFSDVQIDPDNHTIVDLSEYVNSSQVGCASNGDVSVVAVMGISPFHELVTLLDPANYVMTLVVTAPTSWSCEGKAIFREVLAAQWHEEDSFLMIATEQLALFDVIKEGEVRLDTTNLMANLVTPYVPKKANATQQSSSPSPSPEQSGLFHGLQPKRAGRRLQGLFQGVLDWVNENVIEPVVDTVTDIYNAVKDIGTLLMTGKADVNTRLISLSLDMEKQWTFGQDEDSGRNSQPFILDIIVRFGLSVGLNFIMQIKNYVPQLIELSIEGSLTAGIEADVMAGIRYSFEKDRELFKMALKTIKFSIGPIPVIIEPSIPVNVGFEGEMEGALKFSATASLTLETKLGVEYKNGEFAAIKKFDFKNKTDYSLSLHATAYIMPYIKPALSATVNAVAKFAVEFQVGPLLTGTAMMCEVQRAGQASTIYVIVMVDLDLALNIPLVFSLGLDLKVVKFFEDWDYTLHSSAVDLFDFTIGPLKLTDLPTETLKLPTCESDSTPPGAFA